MSSSAADSPCARSSGLRGLPFTLLAAPLSARAAPVKNGFDLAGALVPAEEILAGGPPRDGIPAIDQPVFLPARAPGDLELQDRVLGVLVNGVAKAYPLAILPIGTRWSTTTLGRHR